MWPNVNTQTGGLENVSLAFLGVTQDAGSWPHEGGLAWDSRNLKMSCHPGTSETRYQVPVKQHK